MPIFCEGSPHPDQNKLHKILPYLLRPLIDCLSSGACGLCCQWSYTYHYRSAAGPHGHQNSFPNHMDVHEGAGEDKPTEGGECGFFGCEGERSNANRHRSSFLTVKCRGS